MHDTAAQFISRRSRYQCLLTFGGFSFMLSLFTQVGTGTNRITSSSDLLPVTASIAAKPLHRRRYHAAYSTMRQSLTATSLHTGACHFG